MATLRHHVAAKNITTREEAVEAFWEFHRLYNGGRRSPPEKYVTIKQVRAVESCVGTGYDVIYQVPNYIINEAHERRQRKMAQEVPA